MIQRYYRNCLISVRGGHYECTLYCLTTKMYIDSDATLGTLNFAPKSRYNSSQICLSGTREELIGSVMDWCDNVDHGWQTQIVLLTAVAGAGKSAVAHTIAHLCHQRQLLLSSFFFSKGNVTSPEYLWSGVARYLATKNKSYRQSLTSILKKDPSMATAAFDEQFRELILEPLRHEPPLADNPLIIVIDALDECEEDSFQTLSELLRDDIPKLPRCIKVFVTLRSVKAVDDYFHSSSSIQRMKIELSDHKNLRDCRKYIQSQVSELKKLPRETKGNWLPDFE